MTFGPGYYPPDHSIVTGGSNILDSFEALLFVISLSIHSSGHSFYCSQTFRELADLLGHVKPPTATKEDIDKSGLAIIKAAKLPQHEKDGKVASNCLDRVCFAFLSILYLVLNYRSFN